MSHPELTTAPGPIDGEERPPKRGWRKLVACVGNFVSDEDKGKWLENMRGSLSLIASIITTMTFQLATNPPGGVFQVDIGANISCPTNDGGGPSTPCPGEAVLGVVYPDDYLLFLIFNTVSFVASLSVCLLLVSGIPLNHRFPIWILSIGMWITITSLALTYLFAASMVTPTPIWGTAGNIFDHILKIWIGLLGFVVVFLILRLLRCLIIMIHKCYRRKH